MEGNEGLSPEEIAAMADDDEAEALKDVLNEAGDDDGDDESGDEAQGAGQDEAAAGGEADADDVSDDAKDDDRDDPPFVATYRADPVENFDEKMAALEAREAEVTQQLVDGEIDRDAFAAESKAISKERMELSSAHTKAQIAAEQAQQASQQRWEWEVQRYLRDSAREGFEMRPDVTAKAMEAAKDNAEALAAARAAHARALGMAAALDAEVKRLASDPANEERDGEWFLEESGRLVRQAFGGGKSAAKPGGKPAVPNRRPDLSVVPTTLAHVPAASGDDSTGGEFAHLDSLNGMELEKAIAKMTPDQQRKWAEA